MPSLKKLESKTITKGSVKVTTNLPKWQYLSTHTARRSFATNLFKQGVPSLTIMEITGHKTERSFLKYLRVSSNEHAVKLKDLWGAKGKKPLLKAV